jgi:hypothetical protein
VLFLSVANNWYRDSIVPDLLNPPSRVNEISVGVLSKLFLSIVAGCELIFCACVVKENTEKMVVMVIFDLMKFIDIRDQFLSVKSNGKNLFIKKYLFCR